ncbi:VWA domain-containing protein [Lentzea sp.]|uniref:VWA domain-containing protein n=1 Tax=Lentzea sp. TaxID=56099 RepID=UPI002C031C66|nr:VWA domain-containing protein [Lentzea sp.]HUQ61314.1 VWA domain-containing protein [Lentzea sp.]
MDEFRLSVTDELSTAIQKTHKALKRPDRRRALRIALIIGLVAVLGAGGVVTYRLVFAPVYRTTFLIDTADGDLAGVVGALTTVVGNSGERDSQSLRSFGGDCGAEDNTAQLVGFGTGNRQEIAEAARSVRQGAKATLQRGIVEAVGDFTAPLALKARQVNRIIVVTRHAEDACDTDDEFVQAQIRERVAAAGLSIEFRFIGYQVADGAPLKELTTELKTQDPTLTKTPDELKRALEWFATIEPVLRSSQSVVNVLNPTVDKLNTATESIKAGRFDLADGALAEARDAVVDIEIKDLDGRTSSPDAVLLRDMAVRLRTLQAEVIKAADGLLGSARSGRNLAEPLAVYTRAAVAYNDVARRMTGKLTELRGQGPGGS